MENPPKEKGHGGGRKGRVRVINPPSVNSNNQSGKNDSLVEFYRTLEPIYKK